MKILMCAPDFFDIEYEINPWMHIENKANRSLVKDQYYNLKSIYEKLGIEILEIDPAPSLPDMVYTANFGYVEKNKFIKANFKYDERKGEEPLAAKYFEKLGYEVINLPESIIWEGEGDFLKSGNKYFLGFGKRSEIESKQYLDKILDTDVVTIELTDPYFYHIDTCFAPLRPDLALINGDSFTQESLEKLKKHFKKIIYTTDHDHSIIGCNLVTFENNIIVGKPLSEVTKEELKKEGFDIFENDMSEYLKGGGSVKCCSLIIH